MIVVSDTLSSFRVKIFCEIDLYAMDKLDTLLVTVELLGNPSTRYAVFCACDGLLPILYREVNILLKLRTAIKQTEI